MKKSKLVMVGNGMAGVRTLEELLRSYVSYKQDNWDEHLAAAELAYNCAVHSSTGYSPFFLNYGRHPHLPIDEAVKPSHVSNNATAADRLSELHAALEMVMTGSKDEVVLDATRFERAWNWVGTVPHWIYFTEIRKDQPLWRQVILWTSGVGIVGALTGIWVGLLRLRLKRRYAQGKVTPYQGWMKWHHIGGLVTGLTVTTWIISGWLSVNPNNWLDRPRVSAEAISSLVWAASSAK